MPRINIYVSDDDLAPTQKAMTAMNNAGTSLSAFISKMLRASAFWPKGASKGSTASKIVAAGKKLAPKAKAKPAVKPAAKKAPAKASKPAPKKKAPALTAVEKVNLGL